jgi:hypothetical protein
MSPVCTVAAEMVPLPIVSHKGHLPLLTRPVPVLCDEGGFCVTEEVWAKWCGQSGIEKSLDHAPEHRWLAAVEVVCLRVCIQQG